uniref:Secreted protein n=1 Tax=Raphanus sativus TaxID=3726 RepID=A0A650GBG5_RAPSA|nr:hypothetical protein [Raphanus sativus]
MHQLWLFPPPIPLIHLHLLWNFVQNKLTFPCSCLGELRHSLTGRAGYNAKERACKQQLSILCAHCLLHSKVLT